MLCLIEVFPVSGQSTPAPDTAGYDEGISYYTQQMPTEGKQTFRFDTFGSEAGAALQSADAELGVVRR